jgi:hypothetical protein
MSRRRPLAPVEASGQRTAPITAFLTVALALAAAGAAAAVAPRAAPRAVGSVTAATGTNLYVKRAATGALAPLRTGTVLYLGDVIAAGPGTRATLRLLASDASLPPSTDLVAVFKQLAPLAPTASAVVREFGIAADATRKYATVLLRRTGSSVSLTLER